MLEPIGSWKIRRRMLWTAFIFCMAIALLALILDRPASATTITAAFGAITLMLTSYVFGAVWDDKNRRSAEK